MGAVQFFLFGLFLAWFVGTGKLGSLMQALKNDPPSSAPASPAPPQGNDIVPNPATDTFGSAIGTQAAALAETQVGKSYVFGAAVDTSLKTFVYDCSSLVASVYGSLGRSLPRTSQMQAGAVTPTTTPSIGDLVFGSFSSPNDHVGIYVGGGRVVSALDESHGVLETAANWPKVWFGKLQ